ncbi:MAG: hypothetical protein K1X89_29540, partial [Myxococcaceae bacterium]|nr:hypothetical protein [Myxococcaceae bacterium]
MPSAPVPPSPTTASPTQDRPVELDLRALTKAEDQLAQEESALAAELTAVQNTADRLAQRIEALDQGMTKLRLPRHERMSRSLVPEIDVRAPAQRGLSARAAAVSARYAANRELRELIQGYKQMLQRVSPQVAQGEAVLEAHRAEAARRAEARTQPQVA